MIVDYIDKEGFRRRVELPDGSKSDPSEGIPLSLNVDELFSDCSKEFRIRIVNELWNQGLVEPKHFFENDAIIRIRAALLAAIKYDTILIQTFAMGDRK